MKICNVYCAHLSHLLKDPNLICANDSSAAEKQPGLKIRLIYCSHRERTRPHSKDGVQTLALSLNPSPHESHKHERAFKFQVSAGSGRPPALRVKLGPGQHGPPGSLGRGAEETAPPHRPRPSLCERMCEQT
jgi:hypothetical protein